MHPHSVLDPHANAEFRRRLTALESEIEAAFAAHDDPTRNRAGVRLIAEQRRATGLGGRSRRFSGNAERARKTASARIRDTLRHLEVRHPELAKQLRESVSTGSACRYQPSEGVTWIL